MTPLSRIQLAVLSLALPVCAAAQLPSVASINLCTDQLVLSVADPTQILSLSWLSSDPEESMLAEDASRYPINFGSAEELIAIGADVVIAGSQTSPFTRQMLRELGTELVEIEPATSLADVAENLARIGTAIDRLDTANQLIASMQDRSNRIAAATAASTRSAIVVRAGGFTVGRDTLANELLGIAGLSNSVAELDRWGSLSVETLLTARPEFVVITQYRDGEASLANAFLQHPALTAQTQPWITLEMPARYFACGSPHSLDAAESLQRQMAAH